MELNLNSLHARIFRWVLFVSKDRMPKSLCPYFWQSVLMWVFIIPLLVLMVPVRLIKHFQGGWNRQNFPAALGVSICFYLTILAVYSMGLSVYCLLLDNSDEFFKENDFFVSIGIAFWIIAFFGGFVFGIEQLAKYRNRNRWDEYGKRRKANVIIESIKGIYNKYCPRIDWKDQK